MFNMYNMCNELNNFQVHIEHTAQQNYLLQNIT